MKLAIWLILLSFSTLAKTTFVSHKGIWKNHVLPQNTLAALTAAVEQGYTALEFDIQLSKDDNFVLAHDDKLKRVTDCKGKISNSELEKLLTCNVDKNTTLPLTQLIVRKVKRPQSMTSLAQVLEKFLNQKKITTLMLDLKSTKNDRVLDALRNATLNIKDTQLFAKIIVISTSVETIRSIRNVYPEFRFSLEGKWGSEPLADYEKFIKLAGKTHDLVSLNVGIFLGHEPIWKIFGRKKRFWRMLSNYQYIAELNQVPTIAWTVNRSSKIKKLLKFDFDYLITDKNYSILKSYETH